MLENNLGKLNGNDYLDVQVFLDFLESKGILYIKDGRMSSLADALDEWCDLEEEEDF